MATGIMATVVTKDGHPSFGKTVSIHTALSVSKCFSGTLTIGIRASALFAANSY